MSRQFRSTDTDLWSNAFGSGQDGAVYGVPANIACSATISTKTINLVSASTFANGMIVLVHQTKGTGAGNWELNKIVSGGGTTTLTTQYYTQNTYTNSGVTSNAQIIQLKQYSNLVSGSLTCPSWNGAQGGILAWMDNGITTINGAISTKSVGFRAASEYKNALTGNTDKGEGSGTDTFGTTEGLTANGNGGGGGGGTHTNTNDGSGGGSGGSKTAGSPGHNMGYSTAAGGSAVWDTNGALVTLGGGAGARISASAGDAGSIGTNGSGLIFVFARTITVTGTVDLNSSDGDLTGDTSTYSAGAGGAGSGIFVGQNITLGSSLITANGGQAKGISKYGGNGGIVALYSGTLSGTTSPALDSFKDSIYANSGAAFLLLF